MNIFIEKALEVVFLIVLGSIFYYHNYKMRKELDEQIKALDKLEEQVELSFVDEIMDTPSLNFTRNFEFEYEEDASYTGDEIHFTDGTIWSVVLFSDLWPLLTMEENTVIFVPMSFEQMREQGFVKDYFFISDVKGVLEDALKGGAKIVRGVGLAKDDH